MRIILSGASGLVGSCLQPDLEADGIDVLRLVRSDEEAEAHDAARWDPSAGILDPALLAGADAVVNLNGRNIAGSRWTESEKQLLRSSRMDSTTTLVRAVADADPPPKVLVSASATGYFGDRGEEILDESSSPGDGFLADLARDWEQAALAARGAGIRVVAVRFGMIVARGGALAKMLLPFKLGLGGPIGSGRQWWPWVAIEDVLGVIRFVIDRTDIDGAVNVVSPHQVRCREFTSTLGSVLHRPAVLPAPAFAVRLALGEMADALLLASTRVQPARLEELGYRFLAPRLDDAIRRALD